MPLYPWPGNRITLEDHGKLCRVRNRTKQPINELLHEAVAAWGSGGQNDPVDMEPLVQAVEKLTAELGAIRQAIDETRSDIQWGIRNSQDYLSAIADAADEIRGELLVLARNQVSTTPPTFHQAPSQTVEMVERAEAVERPKPLNGKRLQLFEK